MSSLFESTKAGPAVFSDDRVHRYLLTRTWDEHKPAITYIGLNPSTADEVTLDPTLRRCVSFAHAFGCGSFHMTNLFAFRATEPDDMRAAEDPVGPENDDYILSAAGTSHLVVACWGVHGAYRERDREVYELLKRAHYRIRCFGLTKDGHPKHPLYLHRDTKLIDYRGLRF
jgi:hypothetical protein